MANPYTLVFGQPPMEIVDRSSQAERIISEFSQERTSNYLNLVTGIRGCGKTVFITQIAERLGEDKDWIIINLNPKRDLLISLMSKLQSDSNLTGFFKEAEINLQAFGFGDGIKGTPIQDVEVALTKMLKSIQKHHRRVLITIDEATNSKEMRIFASSYQIFIRERLSVYLLMTGLYHQIERLRNADGMTFLERAPRTELSPLDFFAMVRNYKETLDIREDEAAYIAKATRGYAFAFQTVGYFLWENRGNKEKALEESRAYLSEFAYNMIWSELSAKDKDLVLAIAKTPGGEVRHVREKLNYTSNQFNPYRDRLLKAGIVRSPHNGIIELALPWFGDYAEKRFADESL